MVLDTFLCQSSLYIPTGVFAIICLMVRNGIEQALAVEGLGIACIHDNALLITVGNATNVTCGAIKVQIAVSLAFTSGLIMVCGKCFGSVRVWGCLDVCVECIFVCCVGVRAVYGENEKWKDMVEEKDTCIAAVRRVMKHRGEIEAIEVYRDYRYMHTFAPPPPPQIGMGLLQMGFITIFLSEPLISGYTTGSAVHVFTSQIPYIFGIGINIKPYVPVFHELLTVPRVSCGICCVHAHTVLYVLYRVSRYFKPLKTASNMWV